METSSYHSNQNSWTKTIKNTNFVQTNVISMYAKFQLHPLTASEKKIFEYFRKFTLYVAIATKRIK